MRSYHRSDGNGVAGARAPTDDGAAQAPCAAYRGGAENERRNDA